MTKAILLFILFAFSILGCNHSNANKIAGSTAAADSPVSTNNASEKQKEKYLSAAAKKADSASQVSQYIRRIFQDSKGNLWFGTTSDGVCRFDGTVLKYFTPKEGLSGLNVRSIAEDKDGNLWFATGDGVSEFDGTNFTNFTVKDGLSGNDAWNILIDNSGIIWVGTLEGVCRYDPSAANDGKKIFKPFEIPAAVELDNSRGFSKPKAVWCIMQDRKGNIWFATNGGGVYCYNPFQVTARQKSLLNFSEKDGLTNNFVNWIVEDKSGNLWFATHHNGVSRYDGKSFTNYTDKEGLCGNQVWTMYEDKTGNIWFSAWGSVCRFNGKSFTAFSDKDGLTNCCVQSIYEDKSGNFWFGSGAGLFRFDGKSFMNVTKYNGPWQ